MLHKAIQNRWCRLALAVAATLLYAIGVNWFIVPMGLYTGGLLGFCQVARTLIVEALGLSPNVDFSGILYLAANVPILLLAWQALGRGFLVRTAVCTVTSSLFLSLVPPPAAPLVEETLTNCVLGGILVGFSLGIVLTCGCSTGGLDILGLWLAKKGKGFSVGRFSLSFNALLYTLCAVLFGLRAAIYSIIYTVFCALFIDRGHQQNITEQVLTKKGYTFLSAEVEYVPSSYTRLENEDDIKNMSKMLEMFEDNDDVQNVWHNWENADDAE